MAHIPPLDMDGHPELQPAFATAAAAIISPSCFGGGRHNRLLMERIKDLTSDVTIESTTQLGIDPDYMEATAFAWLAKQCLEGRPGNDPSVTGSRGERVLGVVFPA